MLKKFPLSPLAVELCYVAWHCVLDHSDPNTGLILFFSFDDNQPPPTPSKPESGRRRWKPWAGGGAAALHLHPPITFHVSRFSSFQASFPSAPDSNFCTSFPQSNVSP